MIIELSEELHRGQIPDVLIYFEQDDDTAFMEHAIVVSALAMHPTTALRRNLSSSQTGPYNLLALRINRVSSAKAPVDTTKPYGEEHPTLPFVCSFESLGLIGQCLRDYVESTEDDSWQIPTANSNATLQTAERQHEATLAEQMLGVIQKTVPIPDFPAKKHLIPFGFQMPTKS